MNHPPASVAAFTLIEMMIAIALGSLVVYTAMAGFRAASQTVTAANRLSIENSLLRAGYWEAQTQLDFWTNYDNPNDAAAQKLRAGSGLPFAAITVCGTPRGSTGGGLNTTAVRTDLSDNTWEDDKGWDSTYTWAIHDPRTWSRANLAEKNRNHLTYFETDGVSPIWFGRYAIFAHTNPGTALATFNVRADYTNKPSDPAIPLSYNGYPTNNMHPWYYRQASNLIQAMGYAAFCEYLPPNAIYTWYTDQGFGGLTLGGIDTVCVQPGAKNFCNSDGNQISSRGIYRQTYSASFGYPNPRSPEISNPITNDFNRNFTSDYDANSGTNAQDLRRFLRLLNNPEPIMRQKPDHWPDVLTSVGRLVKNGRHVALARIKRVSSLTAETIELSWTGLGTTLRGARQQRKPGTGWANWDNATGASNDKNLDTQ